MSSDKKKVAVYEFLASQLKAMGIEKVFGLMSEDTAHLVATLDSYGIRFYSARHENSAIGMAEGYASATGKLAVALIGRGPATANGIHAATYASRTGARILLLIGDAPVASRLNKTGPDTKRFRSADVLRAADLSVFQPTSAQGFQAILADAVAQANSGSLACLFLPIDLQHQTLDAPESYPPIAQRFTASVEDTPTPRTAAVDMAVSLLQKAERPLILAGAGAWISNAGTALENLADRVGAVLSSTLKAKDMFSGHPYHIGMVGSFSFGIGRRLIEEADCIVVFGASLNQRTTSYGKSLPSGTPVIHVDACRQNIGRWFHADLGIVGDARIVAEQILDRLPETPKVGFHTPINRNLIESFDRGSEFVLADTPRTVDPRALGIALNALLPTDRRVVYDAGNFLGILQYIDVPSPGHLKNTSEFGSIGLGISTALGYTEGDHDTPTYAFVGDGGLLMSLGELETMAREDVPLVVFVMNDCAYGAETHFLRQHGMPISKSIFADIEFCDVAAVFGIESFTVRSLADLEKLSILLKKPEGPLIVDCKLNGQVAAPFTADHP